MKEYLSSNELIPLLEKKAIHGEKLVVLTGNQWDAIRDAYPSNLFSRINQDALIFHSVKAVNTKETFFIIDQSAL